MSSKEDMEKSGINIIDGLYSKEGIALINGTQVMTAVGLLTKYDVMSLPKTADIAHCLTMEALK